MKMKILLLFVIITFFSSPAYSGDVLIASGHPDWPPFAWKEGDKIIGIGAELTEIIFKDLGIKVNSKAKGNWIRALREAELGRVDVIIGCYITDQRKTYLDYPSIPFMDDENVVWVWKGKTFPFEKWEDLIGKQGVAALGESYGQAFDTFIEEKLNVMRVPHNKKVFQLLEHGRVDYYPFSLYAGKIQVKKYGYEGRVEHLPMPFSKEYAHADSCPNLPPIPEQNCH